MKAIFSPGTSYQDSQVKQYAGWWHILELYRQSLEELGFETFIPSVPPNLIDTSSTVSKITSYDLVSAFQLPKDADIFCGPPGYCLAQMMTLPQRTKKFVWVWNNSDVRRDEMLIPEYQRFNQPYDTSKTWRWINETALKLADCVIACSPFVKASHARVVPENKISIAFWGVDSQMFTPVKIEPPGFRVLFVGGDPIRKGLVYLLEAWKGMKDVELWIVGCKPFRENYDPTVKQFGMVPYAQMPEIMRQCHVLCIPTLEDGIALAVQEGMASGLVPITSPETAEVFEDGVSGIKVEYRDIDTIRNALIMLRDNPERRRQMAREARALAERQTWEETKRQFKEIIRGHV